MENKNVQLRFYLHFNGNCEEALRTYTKILDGQVDYISRFGESKMEVPEDYKNKVLHGTLTFGGNLIYASDCGPGQQVSAADNVELLLDYEDAEWAREIFNRLASGGQITLPLEKQFWGALFGQVTDKYGIRWMINCVEK